MVDVERTNVEYSCHVILPPAQFYGMMKSFDTRIFFKGETDMPQNAPKLQPQLSAGFRP
jgi:hypothetical protein